jgi:hypothetical protein
MLGYFLWIYCRAAIWIALAALGLYLSTGRPKVVRAYVAAHLLALGLAALVDYFMINIAPKSWLVIRFMQWVFVAPIVIFTVISLSIGSWERPVGWRETFMTLVPIAAWGFLMIYGWRWRLAFWDYRLLDCHVLGAWFVSAASGAVDLWTRFGPPWAQRRSYAARLAGYALVILTVYLILPRTQNY